MLISGAVMAIIPILIVFLFFQKYFIEGMTAGGVKG
jgi:arabinosaccharide transport system permease protein